MRPTSKGPRQCSFDELVAYNTARLEQHKQHRCFRIFTDGTLEDSAKRRVFFSCVQVFSRHFQTMLYARQAHCGDERYRPLFLRHLREEIGHDEILAKDRGREDVFWDPLVESAAAWFISRMSICDNVEKLAVIHLVLESSGAYMGSISRDAMRRFGGTSYFELHDEVDQSHITLALEPLERQSPETLARVRVVVEQAWRVLDMWFDRVVELVLDPALAD